jgi:hypothetical protein
VLVAVTDHAADRYRQRIGGTLDAKKEVARRVGAAIQAGRFSDEPPVGVSGKRGSTYVSDVSDRSLVFICRRTAGEMLVVTLWEREGGPGAPRVPRRFTDAIERRSSRER